MRCREAEMGVAGCFQRAPKVAPSVQPAHCSEMEEYSREGQSPSSCQAVIPDGDKELNPHRMRMLHLIPSPNNSFG